MVFKWLPHCKKHCSAHHLETPEINPGFIEQVLEHGHPSRIYPDKTYAHRYVFEAYFPPTLKGRPYRVILEVSDEQEVVPVSCWRIKDKEFRKVR